MTDETPDPRASAVDTLSPLPGISGEDGRTLLAASHGYCADINRAVDVMEKALDLYGALVYVRKEIVHNRFVVESLTKRGTIFIQETDEVPEGARIVFSAHGVSPQVHEAVKARDLATTDVTCPLVAKVHRGAVRFAKDDYDIILVGHQGHEEVKGTYGKAPSRIQVADTPDEVDSIEVRDPERVVWISQITLSMDETYETMNRLRQRFPRLSDPPSDDIYYATQNRQVAVKAIVPRVDIMVIVGSTNSSNSVHPMEVALKVGAGGAHRVGKAEEPEPKWLEGAETADLTSGASVPGILVREAAERLQAHGFPTVEAVRTESETVTFALPHNLRAELAEKGLAGARPHAPRKAGPSHTR